MKAAAKAEDQETQQMFLEMAASYEQQAKQLGPSMYQGSVPAGPQVGFGAQRTPAQTAARQSKVRNYGQITKKSTEAEISLVEKFFGEGGGTREDYMSMPKVARDLLEKREKARNR